MSPLSRRTLLAGGAASLALADTAPIRLPTKVRLGIIGLVGHTSEITAPLASLPDVELVAIADPDRAGCTRLAAGAHFPAATVYNDYHLMLDREKLDMVGVCNDNGARAAAVLACAQRKVHVIAEKPLAVNRADFERIRGAVAANGIKLSMLLPMRFAPQFAAMRRIVQSGEIGEVAQIGSQKSYRTQNWEKWKSLYASYGSTILWIGPHSVDLMRHIGGREMVEAVSFQSHIGAAQLGEMENSTGTLFRLDNGGVGVMRLDYLRPDAAPTHEDDRLRIAGTNGVLEYQASTGLTLVTNTRKPEVIRDLPAQKPLFVDFLESVYLGASPALDLASIYRVNEIVLAADESARQPRIVKA